MKIKRKGIFWMGIVLAVIGAGILLYPLLSQKMYDLESKKRIREFEERVEEINKEPAQNDPENQIAGKPNSFFDELRKKIQEYNEDLYRSGQENLVDPFSYQQVAFSLRQWGFDEDIIGSIEIPRMGIELPIYLGATDENMARGAAHLSQTSLPIGGENTNAVIAAHRGYSRAAMFRDIEVLQTGDEVIIKNFHDTLIYQVSEIKILKPTDIDMILIQPGRDLVTLITCHPYRHNYQRYAVYCERVK